ncbi:MAG: GHKL domain-containing protein, partial [Chlamydiia bacterium]|nr:GHKL domain-containing protein [Chlamydiia bacterium]MCP5509523.1 GHKL domain-containing protein [Chlamydiales bacterium]
MKKIPSLTFKAFFGHLVLFGVLFGAYFLSINKFVEIFVRHKVKKEITQWIPDITTAGNISAMIELTRIKAESYSSMQIISHQDQVLFDSTWRQNHRQQRPVWEKSRSMLTSARVPFEYADAIFEIVVFFDHKAVPLSINDIRIIYIGGGAFFSLLFFVLSLMMLTFFSRPINVLFKAVNDYHNGKIKTLPEVDATGRHEAAVFARALNDLNQEITDLKEKLTNEKQRASCVIESLSEGVIIVDCELNVTYANMKGAKLLGTPKLQLVGKDFREIKTKRPSEALPKCQELAKAAVQNHALLTDSFTVGEENKVHLDIIAVPIGNLQGVALIIQDNSTHHKILTMGKEFIANASHELRTPITIIKGFAEMLHDLPEISESMLEDITDKIVRNCHRMSALVKNLLVLADLDNLPQACLEERDLLVILENCQHQLHTLHPEVQITIDSPKDAFIVNVDSALIDLAIMNLLENAVKYSSAPANITLKISEADDDYIAYISDKGMGIPEQDLDHIFDRFYTVSKSHSRKLGGAGLGLSIVRNIIEKHEGSLDVQSSFGKGTTFIITLPKARAVALL